MKKRTIGKLILSLIVAVSFGLLTACSGEPKSSGKVIVGTQATAAGTTYLDEKGKLTGFEVEVLKEVDKRIPDVEFEFKTMDFGSLFTELGAKKVDIINSNLQYNKERAEKYLYSKEIVYRSPYKIVVNEDDNVHKSLKDLDGKKVSILPGLQLATLKKLIEEQKLNIEILPAKSTAEIIAMVKDGRTTAAFMPAHQAYPFSKFRNAAIKAVGQGYIAQGLTPDQVGAHFLFDKENTPLRDKVDKALAEMRADGTLKKLSIEWLGDDYTKPLKLPNTHNDCCP